MYGKIIWKNVIKNIRDYGIYFFTLLISVSVFYAFNAIESQPAFRDMKENGGEMAEQMISLIGIVSIFIAVMLAFLIIYANQFLLKRRKKEMGIYMTLGMSENRISKMFVAETILIGIFAMAGGIGIGCILSQGISVIALKLFNYDLSTYRFSFSMNALKETLICFIIIYVCVILFNIRTIRTVKLIDMLNASRKNEMMKVKRMRYQCLILACAFVLYALVAVLIYKGKGLNPTSKQFGVAALSICVATAFLIYSMAGLLLGVLRKNKKWYLKNVNAFLIRQISSKIQSNYMTMTVVSLLLTATICIISVGMGMADSMNKMAENATPYDVLIFRYEMGENCTENSVRQELKEKGVQLDEAFENQIFIRMAVDADLTYDKILSNTNDLAPVDKSLPQSHVCVIGLSDYNAAMKMQGKSPVTLEKNTYLINSNYDRTNELLQEQLDKQCNLTIAGIELRPQSKEVLHNTYYMSAVGMNDQGTVIVEDKVAEQLEQDALLFLGNYRDEYDNSDFETKMYTMMGETKDSPFDVMTKQAVCEAFYGMFAIVAFICSYIGVIFLIISVAVLSLQQLTQTNDNVIRYTVLNKIGVESKMCSQTIFKTILVYFGVPLLVGVSYSAVALPKLIQKVQGSIGMEIGTQVIYIVALLLAIYGSYFALTYISCKKMIYEKI